jgi:PleD family two-component response regulator
VSIGVATRSVASPYDAPAALLLAADEAMYAAKQQGRDRIVCAANCAPLGQAVAG